MTPLEAEENKRMLSALRGMVESYDILMQETPAGAHPVIAGVIRGAFIYAISDARACLPDEKGEA
jgi:hypothetical protein